MFDKKKRAMSLAELLAVLTIIAVVAGLSLPSLKKYSSKSEFGPLALKAYVNIEQAIDNALLTKSSMKSWDFSDTGEFFTNYIKPNLKYNSTGSITIGANNYSTINTYDGMIVYVSECVEDSGTCTVDVDVNGNKGANSYGKDRFKFIVDKEDQSVKPHPDGVEAVLQKNNWKFSDNLWNCATASSYNGSCSY